MSVEQNSIHNSLKAKIQELISAYESLKQENIKLAEQKAKLEDVLQERELAYLELDKKFNQQQIAKAFAATSDDSHDAKVKVDSIVREIDNCIALLNR